MTEALPAPKRPWLAWLWLAVVLALAWQQVGFWRAARLDSDVMALLPGAVDDPLLAAANSRMGDAATRQVVVLLATEDWARTRDAATAYATALATDGLLVPAADASLDLPAALAFYGPHRRALLTPQQRAQLQAQPPQALAAMALARLFAPGTGSGFGTWREDPLGLWPDWWQARAGHGLQPRDGLLALGADGRDWAVLRFESRAPAFRLDGERRLQDSLQRAADAATAAIGVAPTILHGGVPLHAEAAAVRAAFEVNTIGLGSLLAVVTLIWLAFRSPRPMLLVALSLVIGTFAGVAATSLLFDRVHLLTLVFGASLVGVAEDYGIHYFACRQGQPQLPPRTLMRQLLPALALALVTSVLAYLALGIAPFPGLRQMAVFAGAGLTAAFLTAVFWFPWLDRGVPKHSRFAAVISASLARWPRWRAGPGGLAIAVLLVAVIAGGLYRLRVDDDLRNLQASPARLVAQEVRIGTLLGLPSPAQFFLVEAADAQELLRREEALTTALATDVAAGRLGGWRSVSDWLPSHARQRDDAQKVRAAEAIALAQAAELAGETMAPVNAGADAGDALLQPADWLSQPLSAPLRPLWLGDVGGRAGSVVMLHGVSPASLAALATHADLPGVRWVDRTASYSLLLGHYRRQMSWLLLAGYVATALVLFWRYGRPAWRAVLPTAFAALLSIALFGWLGVPLTLFGVLAQLLLLGMGVDYGIFLLEHRGDGASWLAVCLGAASTILAFGLLALSATPALHGFGLSLLFGIGAVWLLSPCLRLDATVSHPLNQSTRTRKSMYTPMTSKTFAKPMSALDARFEAQRIAFGPVVFQCVRIALKWGVLERIDGSADGRSTAELAQDLGRSDYALAVLLETCLSAGVVSLVEERWRIEKTGRVLLHDELTRVNLEFVQEICYSGLMELETSLTEARPAGLKVLGPWETIYPGLRDLPEVAKRAWFDFDHHYSDSAFAMALPLVFANKPRTLMDIGANTGKWARRCLDFDADVQMNLVDLPEQIGVARANLQEYAGRVNYHEVDMLTPTPFPGGQDAIWMSQFLSCFSAESMASILGRAAAALNPDGRVFILDTFWDRQQFDIAAYCIINTSPYFTAMANGVSKMYRSQEYIELAAAAGLRLVDIRDGIGLSHSLLTFARI